MKFLCDAMLGHLGRRLRAAGYDTLIDSGQVSDREIFNLAMSEARRLLTCDRGFLDYQGAGDTVIYLAQNDEESWAAHLRRVCGINWLHAPFTRCLQCNELLTQAQSKDLERVPRDARKGERQGLFCATCDKVYWDGGHVRRMRERLQSLNQL